MKLAIMQPYLFPYLGYFQLMRAVDTFVVYDDVNYIKGGWINRNYILGNDGKQLITLPIKGASQNMLINQIEIIEQHKILKSIRHNYSKAPYFEVVYPMLKDVFEQPVSTLSTFLYEQLRSISAYLGLSPQWHVSSSLKKDTGLRGQDKILAICEELVTTQYINMPGGKALYDTEAFAARGIQLSYIQPKAVSYRQFGKAFVSSLSIIDVMMFNDREQCAKLLEKYDLV